MAKTTRQTSIFGAEDWKRIYRTYKEADFQSYDYETIRKSFVDYLRVYYPESFNDFTESSEFIALMDLMSFMGQGLAFRNDMNTRENFMDTAERRDSVIKLAKLIGYTPKRNINAQGFLKLLSIATTEDVLDFNSNSLQAVTVNWNDVTNTDWFEQFNAIMNAAMISSQKYGSSGNNQTLLGISTDEYTLNTLATALPSASFSTSINGGSMAFELTSASSVGKTFLYEPAPQPGGAFNVLYRNDQLGFGGANTGYFFYFKQGELLSQDFNIADRISNRIVKIDVNGINNEDVWLYELTDNDATLTEWKQVEDIFAVDTDETTASAQKTREVYAVQSRSNDQVNIMFGDGTFSKIPLGDYRVYIRSGNGLQYVINTNEMQNIQIPVTYTSRSGRLETITFTLGLQQAVSNAKTRESLTEIKERAPARFYTQNRMVNGEDYNNFPFTEFTSILKSKAIARTGVGVNRQLDLLDPTGKYSSTNIFASDGMMYRDSKTPTFTFSFIDSNDIATMITTQLEPVLKARQMVHFYYDEFARPTLSGIEWNQSTALVNSVSGFFKNTASGSPIPISEFTSSNNKHIRENGLIKFEPPVGYFFDSNNRLVSGTPSKQGEKLVIWATVTALTLDGTNFGVGNLDDGTGPVTLNQYIPSTAIPTEVIPRLITDLPSTLEADIITQVEALRDFGVGYDHLTGTWYIINTNNLNQDADFSTANAQTTLEVNTDASWLAQFTTDGISYTTKYRSLEYYFASVIENRFIYDDADNVYDSKTGKTINDSINILRSNSKPDSNNALDTDVVLDIVGQEVEQDGFIDNFKVLISYADKDSDNVADDPDFFTTLVDPTVNVVSKLVFFERTVDFDNLERFIPLASGTVNTLYATLAVTEAAKTEYTDGQIFYTTTDTKFYKLSVIGTTYTLTATTNYIKSTGRQDFNFQYSHNSSNTRRIDPANTNIIDLYLVTNTYYTDFTNYIVDSTGTVIEPIRPTIDELSLAYTKLNQYKMASDNIVMNSVKFKPMFGPKAPVELQGSFKVIKNIGVVVSEGEIKSRLVESLNEYFSLDNWDFGDTFYFSELSAFLHRELGDIISSVVIVPTDPTKTFGGLYEVKSSPDEIFMNAAGVTDVEVVTALTSTVLRQSTT
jgi:hypothetical protein